MLKRIIAAILMALLLGVPMAAFVATGDIVHDPISYANALLMLAELIKNYEQLKAQYEHNIWMAQTVPLDMSVYYRTVGVPWYGLQVPSDQFGKLAGWLSAVNNAVDASGGYHAATVELRPITSKVDSLASAERAKTASNYASLELSDGTSVHTMETVGTLRANSEIVDKAIENLEWDSLSQDPAMNTEIAVLNKINAAAIVNLRSSRDANRAMLSVLEHQLVQGKIQRDALVSEMNVGMARLEKGAEVKAERTGTIYTVASELPVEIGAMDYTSFILDGITKILNQNSGFFEAMGQD